ncbi:MAG: hypothetical protein ACU84Q_20550 [Gammaproteobacteria bacterium]
MTDNQGYGDLDSYGGVRAETPRIDQLASEGARNRVFGRGNFRFCRQPPEAFVCALI